MMKTLFEHATILTMNDDRAVFEDGYLLIDQGKIADVSEGAYTGDRSGMNVVDARDRIIIPGLINAHTHSYANIVKGTTENIPLEIWMLYIMAEGKNMSREDQEVNAALGSIEMLKSGTTTFLDHLAQDLEGLALTANQYKKAGIRALVTPMFGDRPYGQSLPEEIDLGEIGRQAHKPSSTTSDDWRGLIEMVESVIRNLHRPDEGISVAIGPSGPQRSTDELLTATMELAQRHDLPWHTHLVETKAQELTAHRLYHRSMVRHLDELGILNARVSLAHSVWLSRDDIDVIGERGASVVHNPASNLILGSGIMPIIPLKEAGVHLALGTDGSNCSGFQSMFESMKLAASLAKATTPDYSRWITAADVLEMATRGSARAVGMSEAIGSIEAGKKADFVLLNRKSTNFAPLNNLIWQLVYGRADSAIVSVYVGGKEVVANGKMTAIDEEAVYREAMERGRSILKQCEDDYAAIRKLSPKLHEMLKRVAAQSSNKVTF